jgi:hypothetical protein
VNMDRLIREMIERAHKGRSRSHNRKIYREEVTRRFINLLLYGTSHPEFYK